MGNNTQVSKEGEVQTQSFGAALIWQHCVLRCLPNEVGGPMIDSCLPFSTCVAMGDAGISGIGFRMRHGARHFNFSSHHFQKWVGVDSGFFTNACRGSI